jgi:hypothetical protein
MAAAFQVLRFFVERSPATCARHLKESGTPLLAIPIPDVGKYCAFFLPRDVAARIQIPSRRMLREAAERRIVAARKKNWADYRQSKEIALNKPMRRIGAKGLRKSVQLSDEKKCVSLFLLEFQRHSAVGAQNRSFNASCTDRGPPI